MEPRASSPAATPQVERKFHVLVGVTGSVAALKLPLLVSRLLDISGAAASGLTAEWPCLAPFIPGHLVTHPSQSHGEVKRLHLAVPDLWVTAEVRCANMLSWKLRWSQLREPSISTAPRTFLSPSTVTLMSGRCGSAALTQFYTLTCGGGRTSWWWRLWMPTLWGRWPVASVTTCFHVGAPTHCPAGGPAEGLWLHRGSLCGQEAGVWRPRYGGHG
ncbi:phosphopantothenoylcysteine decarboxylase isoform X3 [Heterocephalus glaber]|uniref:Phosphopantothenoylcysteine decarboxylase isoform X3 n=1 Tax=Heterocephalus glaber TaxID=10181 RepID=A0AAX6S6T4_HETGA|nr:phosphopantothenoylcysteine decarboxylase isoform X3 [Heterocephalus glaber]